MEGLGRSLSPAWRRAPPEGRPPPPLGAARGELQLPAGPAAASRRAKMAAAGPRGAGAAPPGYTGEGPGGGGGGGSGGWERLRALCDRRVSRSPGGEVRGAAALAALPAGEGAPRAGGARRRAPARPHPLRPQRAPLLRPGECPRGRGRAPGGAGALQPRSDARLPVSAPRGLCPGCSAAAGRCRAWTSGTSRGRGRRRRSRGPGSSAAGPRR